jgi:hypothetical protein
VGVEYNQLGEECESRKESQRKEICMGWDNNFRQSSFFHEEKVESKKESMELVKPWSVNSRSRWSVLENIWSWKMKSWVVKLEE